MAERFTMRDLQQLDEVSYDEIDRIIAKYEAIRTTLGRWLRVQGSAHEAATYDKIDLWLSELSQTRDVKKRRAILAQMKKEAGV